MSLASFLLKMHISTTIKIPTGVGPIVALGTGTFDVALGTAGVQVLLEQGFGIGVDLTVGPFATSASYTQIQSILIPAGALGLGIGLRLRLQIRIGDQIGCIPRRPHLIKSWLCVAAQNYLVIKGGQNKVIG